MSSGIENDSLSLLPTWLDLDHLVGILQGMPRRRLQRDLSEEGRLTLTVGGTIPWPGVSDSFISP